MNNAKRTIVPIFASTALIILILDTKTASAGAYKGIQLCINSFVPTFLPFIILTKLICTHSVNKRALFLPALEKLTGIPSGAGRIILLGFIGGYPLGAQCIEDAHNRGELKLQEAKRMLGFCSNAGPAFIFGVLGPQFGSFSLPLWLMIIHISSALLVGIILPQKAIGTCNAEQKQATSITEIVESSVRSVSIICCWIVLFRIILEFLNNWCLYRLPPILKVLLFGILELANGMFALNEISHAGTKFVLAAFMLGFGGICVGIQTLSCAQRTGPGMYFPGKILQCLFSVILAYIGQWLLFSGDERLQISYIQTIFALTVIAAICIFLRRRKKVVAFT